MKKISYITSIALDNISGGFSAMNRAMFDFLTLNHDVDYIGPINPKSRLWPHIISKAGRILGLGGDFYHYSEHRLDAISKDVDANQRNSTAEFSVFHGFTPWIHTHPRMPYVAWNDCTFWQYIHIFHDSKRFRECDLLRIKNCEAAWLRGARRVIFRSSWAATEAIRDYHLDEARVGVVGNYGFSMVPSADTYSGSRNFLMITTHFEQKGGHVALEAFRAVRKEHPDSQLLIVGANPGKIALQEPGVVYLGWIDKSKPADRELLSTTISQARCLVHPTTADTNPMVLIEAGYSGCPAISTRRHAIPELVKDGDSGILLDDPSDVPALTDAMLHILERESCYQDMRKQARAHMLQGYTRDAFVQRLDTEIQLVERELSERAKS